MLHIHRRHEKKFDGEKFVGCPYHPRGEKYVKGKNPLNKCSCSLHLRGSYGGKSLRHSLDTRNLEQAQRRLRETEADPRVNAKDKSVSAASGTYIEDCDSRGLSKELINRYRSIVMLLATYCAVAGVSTIRAIDIELLSRFTKNLGVGPTTMKTRIGDLRTFFYFCFDKGWVNINPAARLKQPRGHKPNVMPFAEEAQSAIMAALALWPDGTEFFYTSRARLRAYPDAPLHRAKTGRPCRTRAGIYQRQPRASAHAKGWPRCSLALTPGRPRCVERDRNRFGLLFLDRPRNSKVRCNPLGPGIRGSARNYRRDRAHTHV
jgi:hypothetical protein